MRKDNVGHQDGSAAPSDWTGQPGPIVSQPTSNPGLQQIQMIPLGVPPGLEYLEQVDGVKIIQEPIEWGDCKSKRRYKIYDKLNQQIFEAKKDKDICSRDYWCIVQQFELSITDMSGQEVIRFERPLGSVRDSWCFYCGLRSIDVLSSNGTLLGTVEEESSFSTPKYVVKNDQGEHVLQIKGPCTPHTCGSDIEFYILSLDGSTEVGKISRKWGGIPQELYSTENTFDIEFPMDLDVKMKAAMIGTCLLINFMYYLLEL